MATFCKYCGKALQDGEICSCPQAQAEAAQQYQSQQPQQPPQGYQQPPQGGYQMPPQGYQPPQQPAGPNPVVVALQKILPYLQSYFKAPVSAAQDLLARKDMIFAAVLLCVQIIVGGLLTFSCVGSYLSNIQLVMGGAEVIAVGPYYGDAMETIMDLEDAEVVKGFSANFFMSLIFGVLATAAVIAIFILIAFAVSKISGSGCSIQDVVIAAAAHSPLVTVLLLLSFICFFFLLPLGVIFLLAAMLAWMVLAIPTLQALAPNAPQGKFWISAFAGILVVLLVGTWAAYTIGSMSVGHATYKKGGKSHTINELRDENSRYLTYEAAGRDIDFD